MSIRLRIFKVYALLLLIITVFGFQNAVKIAKRGLERVAATSSDSKPWSRRESTAKSSNSNPKPGEKVVQDWKSGQVFRQPRSRRNDPWWMREEEKTNPRVLPIYKPWWLDNVFVDDSWKVADLRKEASRRGMLDTSDMKKSDLLTELHRSSLAYDLSNKGFKPPAFRRLDSSALPACYPEVYEGGSAAIEVLRENSFLNAAAPAARAR